MTCSRQVTELLDAGYSYEAAARELRIAPGLAFMLATGLPADGGGVPAQQKLAAGRVLPGSSQHLIGPPAFNPTKNETVLDWVSRRARRELRPSA